MKGGTKHAEDSYNGIHQQDTGRYADSGKTTEDAAGLQGAPFRPRHKTSGRSNRMNIAGILTIAAFWGTQVLSQLCLKWGSASTSRWLWGFAGGNIFGLASVFMLMLAYRSMNPNIAFGLCTGGAFILSQIMLSLTFRYELTPVQWAGLGTAAMGMIIFAQAKPS